jgi:hypothetical protein
MWVGKINEVTAWGDLGQQRTPCALHDQRHRMAVRRETGG